MAVYINSDEDDTIITPEITAAPKSQPDMADYVETYLRTIREDLMRFMDGTWRLIVVDDHLEAQQFDSATQSWIRRFRIRGEQTS